MGAAVDQGGAGRPQRVEERTGELGRDGDGRLDVGTPRRDERQRARDRRDVVGDLLPPAAGEDCEHRPRGVEALLGEERPGMGGRSHDLDERVADERDGHARLAVERLLEREDHEHAVDGLPDLLEPAAPPGPDLGRDVVDDRDSAPLQLAREAQIEVGVVDEDGEVGALGVGAGEQFAEDAPQAGQVAQHFEEADDREIVDVRNELTTLGLQAVAAEAERVDVFPEGAEVADELGRVEVA